MATEATDFSSAVSLILDDANALHKVINNDASTDVDLPEGGVTPSLRKAIVENWYWLEPIEWSEGDTSTAYNQPYFFEGKLYFAPAATASNPVALGSDPTADTDNWLLSDILNNGIIVFDSLSDAQTAGGKLNSIAIDNNDLLVFVKGINGTYKDGADPTSTMTLLATTLARVQDVKDDETWEPDGDSSFYITGLGDGTTYVYTMLQSSVSDLGAVAVFDQTISSDFTILSTQNALSINPTVASGVTATLNSGAVWLILGSTK